MGNLPDFPKLLIMNLVTRQFSVTKYKVKSHICLTSKRNINNFVDNALHNCNYMRYD